MELNVYEQIIREKEEYKKYAEMLKECNKMYNLTAIIDDEGIFYKHFLDSLAGEWAFETGAKVIEIGSGGGFPSLPIKIYRPDLTFHLMDATGKKCSFLQSVVDNLGLQKVTVINGRAEEMARKEQFREQYDVCCARAVARLNTLCEYCLPFVKVGGQMIAYKGDALEEVEEATHAIQELGGEVSDVVSYELPNGMGARTLVIIEKVKKTPNKYPRGQGKERKNPL